ncbi:MAG: ABC transporter ATP-binding protein [bacterium]|nr:ABC transporter ATP-binding protein [bacterium]
MHALEVHQAIKNYNKVKALKRVSLTVRKGEFFGLLGPNGAGKTTLIQAIVGLCRLSGGTIQVFDHDVVAEYKKARQLIGYSPQEMNFEKFFTIEKNLLHHAGFFGIPRKERNKTVQALLKQFGLTEKARVQIFKLSGGMQKRALICKALVSKPQLLILDEPTAGVDVEQRHDLWKYLRRLNAEGTTIILTTHYIDEAQALCERVGIINLGEIKVLDSPQNLINKYCDSRVCIETNKPLNKDWFANCKKWHPHIKENSVSAHGERAGVMTEELLRVILKQPSYRVEDISVNRGDLEDVFLKVTGKSFGECEK